MAWPLCVSEMVVEHQGHGMSRKACDAVLGDELVAHCGMVISNIASQRCMSAGLAPTLVSQ